jgi:uncharacterized 2Fe-2S/4Fe-4S cluster protein (DUF4445 family)
MTVIINGIESSPAQGATIFQSAKSVGVRVPTSCVEQGKCRECLVEIEEGAEKLSPRAEEESHLAEGFRLACRARFVGEGEGLVRCHTLRRSELRIVEHSSGLPEPADLDPAVTREHGRVLIDGELAASWDGPIHGLALDVGTTTVALRLYDLEDGRLIATTSFENPQRFGGSDVMARIHYDAHHKGRLLRRTLHGYLRQAIEQLPAPTESIFETTVAANTTMRDLFFGLDVSPIGRSPYRSTTETEMRSGKRASTALSASGSRLKCGLRPVARLYGLPVIGSHVGADAAAAVLATRMHERSGISVLMDIGTNTELVVGNRDRLVAASCPAGPAFEGGGVLSGMPALAGAIEHISIEPNGAFRLDVIGNGAPLGICGSGLVDLLAELQRTGRMNAQGRFDEELSRVVVDESARIVFTEADVNELAQAKGANVAGMRVLQDVYGFDLEEVEVFYLAGGFARHLDLDAARSIGLIPDLPDDRIRRVGNAALEGAAHALLSLRRRRELEELVEGIEHISLETHPGFFDYFVEGCQFVPIGAEVMGA